MLFKNWKQDKMDAKVSACAPLEAVPGSKYYDFLGKVSEIGPEMDNYEVVEPAFCESKQTWLIDLIRINQKGANVMAKKMVQYDALPEEFEALPQAVQNAVAFWAHNTKLGDWSLDRVEDFNIYVRPILNDEYETYIVVRIEDKYGSVFQGRVKYEALCDTYASLIENTKKAVEEADSLSFHNCGFRTVTFTTKNWEWQSSF